MLNASGLIGVLSAVLYPNSGVQASTAFVDQVDTLLGRGTEGLIEARKLLDTAAGQHRTVATLASQGSGVDRHLFSLLSLAGELGFGADAA